MELRFVRNSTIFYISRFRVLCLFIFSGMDISISFQISTADRSLFFTTYVLNAL